MTVFGESGVIARRPRFITTFGKTLAQMLLFGIVGPIFLVMYFVIDEPNIEWMLYWGVGVTTIIVVLAVVLSVARTRTADKMAYLEAAGVLAQADITAVEQTGVQINDQPVMRLSLRIHGDGIATFDASSKTVVPLMSLSVVNARRLAVLVAPGTQDYVIDWQRSALLSGTVPGVFTSTEDGREYDLTGQAAPLMQILKILKANGIRGNGLVDIRSNPIVRGQVMDVVRRASQAAAPVVAAPKPSVADDRPIGDRLAELENLRTAKAITDEEYATMRTRILDSL